MKPYVYTNAYTFTCTCTCTCAQTHMYIYLSTHTHTHTQTYIYICISTKVPYIYIYQHMRTHKYIYIYIYYTFAIIAIYTGQLKDSRIIPYVDTLEMDSHPFGDGRWSYLRKPRLKLLGFPNERLAILGSLHRWTVGFQS